MQRLSDIQNSIGDATLTLNSVDSSMVHDVSNGPNVLSTGWPRATLVCRPNSHPFQVRIYRKSLILGGPVLKLTLNC